MRNESLKRISKAKQSKTLHKNKWKTHPAEKPQQITTTKKNLTKNPTQGNKIKTKEQPKHLNSFWKDAESGNAGFLFTAWKTFCSSIWDTIF